MIRTDIQPAIHIKVKGINNDYVTFDMDVRGDTEMIYFTDIIVQVGGSINIYDGEDTDWIEPTKIEHLYVGRKTVPLLPLCPD